jgi:hypothetical protein
MKLDINKLLPVAAAAAALLVYLKSGKQSASGAPPQTGGERQRMEGVNDLYTASQVQQAQTRAAVAANWANLNKTVFNTQPDFWV